MKEPNSINDWKVDVKFQANGALLATATGVLLVPPQDAVAFVTDAAGDKLFRVVERKELQPAPSGSRRVEVVNKAAIRVLAWKLWSRSNVVYEIQRAPPVSSASAQAAGLGCQQRLCCVGDAAIQQLGEERVTFQLVSSSMLQSLSGTWRLQPIKLHTSALPQGLLTSSTANTSGAQPNTSKASVLQSKAPSIPQGLPSSCSTPPAAAAAAADIDSMNPKSLRIKTLKLDSPSCEPTSPTSPSSSPTKTSFMQRLALLSPRSRHTTAAAAAAAGAPGELQRRPVVEITARTSSGPFSGGRLSHTGDSSSASGGGGFWGSLWGTAASKGAATAAAAVTTSVPPGLLVDAEGYVTATYVHYEQLAQPKGMPPGIRYVPGLSDAVAASVGKEVRQMLEKVGCVSDTVVSRGLSPPAALHYVVQQMEAAGGSFKAMQKCMRKQKQQQQQQQRAAAKEQPAATAAAAGGRGDVEPLLCGEGAFSPSTAFCPLLMPFGSGADSVWEKERAGGKAAAAVELMSHPVLLADCSWADATELDE